MTGDYEIKKVDEDDPRRCQFVIPQAGQCRNQSVENGDRCPVHGGNKQVEAHERKILRNYQLAKWQVRVGEKANNSDIKSLRDEVGILRIIMEERLLKCTDSTTLLLQSGPITDLALKIEKLVVSCHKLEGSLGQVLDKPAILNFAAQVINIVSDVIEGCTLSDNEKGVVINTVADRLVEATGKIGR